MEPVVEVPRTGPSRGYWTETWRRFRRRKLAMVALVTIVLLFLVALCSPAIVGTKPIVCNYKGNLYFPCLGYFNPKWENPIFIKDKFRGVYPRSLKQKDAESWAVWPLVYQDPYRRVKADEWHGVPSSREMLDNPVQNHGKPSAHNFFGTTPYGVDVFAGMVHGTRIAVLVGFVSMGIASFIGITIGALAGYFRGWIDVVLSRLIEVVMCIPTLVLILALISVIAEPTVWHLMAIIGVTSWTSIARLTRAEFLKLREMDYVAAARALGASHVRIIFIHVLRNALAPVLVPISFGVAAAILIESALSFLGFGAPPPNPSWGNLLHLGQDHILGKMWWLVLFPGLGIFLTVLCYNLVGEGLQEATDPRLRQAGK
ncbi:MAG: ABC transporter permease [Planctomycetia bacterium]|nr:ABC transporter permease [Planctomycetia bacterium]